MLQEPEWERIVRKYLIADTEIIKIEGLITKKKIAIPYNMISDLNLYKGVLGRILNFGNVKVPRDKHGSVIAALVYLME